MKKSVLLVPVFLLLYLCTWAQQRNIKGEVHDYATNQPIIGATVATAGNQVGTTTDANGKFSLQLPSDVKRVSVSYVGYETQSVSVDSSNSVIVMLRTSENSLQQLVVVGYGTQRKEDLTGAVSTVNVEQALTSKPLINTDKMLQGVVPGLTLTYSNGGLTTGPTITLRGVGSVNGSSAPLILVDNVETPDLSLIDPNDIASISVLKDAAAASIYGARAAFGVVLIKTKYGHHNQPTRISYSNNFSWNTYTTLPDFSDPVLGLQAMLDGSKRALNQSPDEFGMLLSNLIPGIKNWEEKYAGKRKGIEMVPGEDFVLGTSTNGQPTYFYRVWDVKKMMLNKYTPQQTQNLSISGGTQKVTYYLSAGYNSEKGIMKMNPDQVQKYNISAAVDVEATNWLDLSAKIMYRNFDYTYPYQYLSNYFYYMWRWGSYFPYGTYQGYYFRHPPAYLSQEKTSSTTDNYTRADLGATIRPLRHLTIQANYTIGRDNALGHVVGGPIVAWDFWTGGTPLHDVTTAGQKFVEYNTGRTMVNTFNGYATYEDTVAEDHHFKVMGGMNAEDDQYIYFDGNALDPLDPSKPELNLTTGQQTTSSEHTNSAYAGFFGRANYDYKDKYLLEINGRYDGSSQFSPLDRWAFFTSGSVGYRISDEPFMEFIKPFVSDLKLRASLGENGNLDVGGQYFIPTMDPYLQKNISWIVNGQLGQTFNNPLAVAQSLMWEKIKTLDFGVDFSILRNYISGSFDWYQRDNIGMLATNSVAATFGATAPRTNQGNMRDKGFEVDLNFNYPVTKDLKVFASLNLSNNKAVITKWNNPTKVISDNYKGEQYGAIWGFKTDGYFTSDQDVTNSPTQAALEKGNFTYEAGDIKFKDLNGDGKIDGGKSTATDHGDLTIIGNSLPQYTYGATLGAQWKGLDISVFLQGVGKRDYWGTGQMVIPYYTGAWVTYKNQLDYWTPTNTNARFPKPYIGNSSGTISGLAAGGNDFYPQSKYLLNLAYCRLKNLAIGYTLPSRLVKKVDLYKVRIYASGENLLTFSNVGAPLDPEITDGYNGFTGTTYPFQKNYSFGLQVTF